VTLSGEGPPAADPPRPAAADPPGGWTWAPPADAPPADAPPERPDPPTPARSTATVVVLVLAVAAVGPVLGLVWAAVAPEVPLTMTEGGPVFTSTQPEEFIAADGWFMLLGSAFGVLAAIAVWLVGRRVRGPVGLLAAAAGTVAAAALAWWVGRQIGLAAYEQAQQTAAVGASLERPNDLRIAQARWWPPALSGVLLIPALVAAVTYTLMAAWSRFSSLREEWPDEPDRSGPQWS
jgi:hypothetical protein